MSYPEPGATLGEHFAGGVAVGRTEQVPSLQVDAEKFQAQVPRHYLPRSVLGQTRWSSNGQSDRSAERILPGMDGGVPRLLPGNNGLSEDTNSGRNQLMMAGSVPV